MQKGPNWGPSVLRVLVLQLSLWCVSFEEYGLREFEPVVLSCELLPGSDLSVERRGRAHDERACAHLSVWCGECVSDLEGRVDFGVVRRQSRRVVWLRHGRCLRFVATEMWHYGV